MDSQKVIYENIEKKTFILQQTYVYIGVTEILTFYEVLFCTYCKVCFVFEKQPLCLYFPVCT